MGGKKMTNTSLETSIKGSVKHQVIDQAVQSFLVGLINFLNLEEISFLDFATVHNAAEFQQIVRRRVLSIKSHVIDVILKINQRAALLHSDEYFELIQKEISQWNPDGIDLPSGIRTCVDAGVTREAIAGTNINIGRSLAGDDELFFHAKLNSFVLAPSTLKKRVIHDFKRGRRTLLEIIVEHTGCGRRGQMNSNLDTTNTSIAALYRLVFSHLPALASHFGGNEAETLSKIRDFQAWWKSGEMTTDGGVWAGILTKIAQRQAFKQLSRSDLEVKIIVPIELYDKFTGDLYVGVDSIDVLHHSLVKQHHGLTNQVLEELVHQGLIFSMRHWMTGAVAPTLAEVLPPRGQASFSQLQTDWMPVKQLLVSTTDMLWRVFHDSSDASLPLKQMVEQFLSKLLHSSQPVLRELDAQRGDDLVSSQLIKNRLTHQLFRAMAYAWVLDTFERGNAPGKHMEDHLATGEPAEHGVMEHLPLGQGDMRPPKALDMFTGYTVLLHSTPGKKGEPILLMMKHDTTRPHDEPLTTEETERTMQDFMELIKLWPYIVLGGLVPVLVIRNKSHGGVDRVALSPVLAFDDIPALRALGALPSLVPAINGSGKVVLVPAQKVIETGISAGENLKAFRQQMVHVADQFSDYTTQDSFAKQYQI